MPEYVVRAILPKDLDAFTRGYLECAEWAGMTGEDSDEFLTAADCGEGITWTDETLTRVRIDCADFQNANEMDLRRYYESGRDESAAGHDFYLTRNRHGAGFWDRGAGPAGESLSRAAHVYGETYVSFDWETNQLTEVG